MIRYTSIQAAAALGIAVLACATLRCSAQASYAATGPGSYVTLGATFAGFNSGQYGNTLIAGGTLFLDANLYRRVGIEAEARELNLHETEGLRETNYLIGPKLSLKGRRFRPYAKLLVGRGDFRFPFGYAYGKYFMIAPGAGIDWRVNHSRFSFRLLDVEYQVWPDFKPFGEIHPYGASAGFSYQITDPKR